jgi:hypothetical protein
VKEQESVIRALQCQSLKDLCNFTHFDPPDERAPGGKFRTLVGLELKHPDDPKAQSEFALLALQPASVQGAHIIPLGVTKGIHIMHCPGHPCPQPIE